MVIYEFRKNSKSKVTIELGKFMGKEIIDIRVWFLVPGTANEWKRTRKGIAMDIRHLGELSKGVVIATSKAYANSGNSRGSDDGFPLP